MKNKKTGLRWNEKDLNSGKCEDFINKAIEQGYEVKTIEGVLNDNYLIYDITAKWEHNGKKHKVKFDYLIFRERNNHYLTSHEMIGIKKRGMTEDERKLLESFLEEYDEQEDERERWYNENKK